MRALTTVSAGLALSLAAALPAAAFSFDAHVIGAEHSFRMLPAQLQKTYEAEAQALLALIDDEEMLQYLNRYDASAFARISILPDLLRRTELPDTFALFGQTMPDSIAALPEKAGSMGHYINIGYVPGESANDSSIRVPNVTTVLPAFKAALPEVEGVQRAIVNAYITHLVFDATQPMHAIAWINEDYPAGDLGGNATCFQPDPIQGGCARNLHSLFDSLAGWTVSYRLGMSMDDAIAEIAASETPADQSRSYLPIAQLSQESSQYAEGIYGPVLNGPIESKAEREAYQQQWQPIMKGRLNLAAHRLADLHVQRL
ncbi:S1/P1 nuclease [Ferrimonas pelagia]|uniref:S1/P1 Nuclease n=1 Tax=Ferrimonas pelagia TaxID=1177826 RepID=A0ABP9EIH9_9GAMM